MYTTNKKVQKMANHFELPKIPKNSKNLTEEQINKNIDNLRNQYMEKTLDDIMKRPDIKKALKLLYENGD